MLLKDYHIGKGLFEDLMGQLFVASTSDLDRAVIFKILHERLAVEQELVEAFHAAAERCCAVRGDGILQALEHGEEQEKHFIIYENFNLSSLEAFLEEQSLLPLLDATALIEKLAVTLRVAHIEGFFHGCLTPQNIFVDESLSQVKIANFGFDDFIHLLIQKRHETVGPSLPYLSQETRRGMPLTRQSDVFSLGALFYRLLIGETPWQDGTLDGGTHSHQTIIPPSLHRLEIPEFIDTLILEALHPDAVRRPQNLSHFIKNIIEAKSDLLATFTPTTQIVIDHLQAEEQALRSESVAAATETSTDSGEENETNGLTEEPLDDTTQIENPLFTEVEGDVPEAQGTAWDSSDGSSDDGGAVPPGVVEARPDPEKSDLPGPDDIADEIEEIAAASPSELIEPHAVPREPVAVAQENGIARQSPLADANEEPSSPQDRADLCLDGEKSDAIHSIQLREYEIVGRVHLPGLLPQQTFTQLKPVSSGKIASRTTNGTGASGDPTANGSGEPLWTDLQILRRRSKASQALRSKTPGQAGKNGHKPWPGISAFADHRTQPDDDAKPNALNNKAQQGVSLYRRLWPSGPRTMKRGGIAFREHERLPLHDSPEPLNLYPARYSGRSILPMIAAICIGLLTVYVFIALVFDLALPFPLASLSERAWLTTVRARMEAIWNSGLQTEAQQLWAVKSVVKGQATLEPLRNRSIELLPDNGDFSRLDDQVLGRSPLTATLPIKAPPNHASPGSGSKRQATARRSGRLVLSVVGNGKPQIADVYFDGVHYGTTSATGIITIADIEANSSHLITVQKTGFDLFARQVDVTQAGTQSLVASLTPVKPATPERQPVIGAPKRKRTPQRKQAVKPKPKSRRRNIQQATRPKLPGGGTIRVEISSPRDLSDVYVYVNGNLWNGEDYIAPAALRLPEGNYVIEVRKEGFISAPLSYSIDVADGDIKTVTFILLPN